ncbi:MAG: hypothetical protein QME21_06530 [Anaerolineales bacterium]|nr:hypothetical protein [Anaerolineales bacterium]
MQPIEVAARFEANGEIHPLQFIWHEQVYNVLSTGRRWRDETGLHILVMAAGERVFELIFQPDGARWFLKTPMASARPA